MRKMLRQATRCGNGGLPASLNRVDGTPPEHQPSLMANRAAGAQAIQSTEMVNANEPG